MLKRFILLVLVGICVTLVSEAGPLSSLHASSVPAAFDGVFIDSGQHLGDTATRKVELYKLVDEPSVAPFLLSLSEDGITLRRPKVPGGYELEGIRWQDPEGRLSGFDSGNLDGHGFQDVYITRSDGPDWILYTDPDGLSYRFVWYISPISLQARDVALLHINGDQLHDVVIAGVGVSQIWYNNGRFLGATDMTPGPFFAQGVNATDIEKGDLDNDGDLDIVISGNGRARVWWNANEMLNMGPYLNDTETPINDASLGDFNDDGYLDALLAHQDYDPLVAWNNGDGTFANQTLFATKGAGRSAPADIDGDGDLDVVISKRSAYYGESELWLNEDGVFVLGQALQASEAMNLATGDLNEDGTLDIYLANDGPDQILFQFSSDYTNHHPIAVDDYWLLTESDFSQTVYGYCTRINWPNTNDTDPDFDEIELYDIGATEHAETGFFGDTFLSTSYCVSPPLEPFQDSFPYAITDGSLFAQVDVHVVVCLGDPVCPIHALDQRACINVPAGMINSDRPHQDDSLDLNLFYRLRDEILVTTVEGQRLRDEYYDYTPELLYHLATTPALVDATMDALLLWQPHIRALVEGQGDTAMITQDQIDAVRGFINELSLVASPNLQMTLRDQARRVGTFQLFIGRSMEDLRQRVVGYDQYLPVLLRPGVS